MAGLGTQPFGTSAFGTGDASGNAQSGTLSLTVSGAVALAGRSGQRGSLALSGTGSLTLTPTQLTLRGTFAPAGSGSLTLFGTASGATAKGGTLPQTVTGSLALSGLPAARGTFALTGAGTVSLSGVAAAAPINQQSGSLGLSAAGNLVLTGFQRVFRVGTILLGGGSSLTLLGTSRDTRPFYRARRPIYLGPGASFARGYNINEVVPDQVVSTHDLADEVYLTTT